MNTDFIRNVDEAADRYEREVAKFGAHGGMPRQSTIDEANKQVVLGVNALYEAQVLADARQETIDYYSMLNERYEREGVGEPSDEMLERELEAQQADGSEFASNQLRFYEAVYRVDAVLTPETREELEAGAGATGYSYEAFVNNKHLEEQQARDAELEAVRNEAGSMGGAKSTFVDKTTGATYQSLVSPDGEDTKDDYGFDDFH